MFEGSYIAHLAFAVSTNLQNLTQLKFVVQDEHCIV